MAYLLDTSVLARLANTANAPHAVAVGAVMTLHRRGEVLHVTPQVLIEFRSVANRPVEVNGLGPSVEDAEALAAADESRFPLLADTPDVYPTWKALAGALEVIGKQVHDARLVAICHVHQIPRLLTFNTGHFSRMAAFGPGLVVVDPADVL
jgi:predicted nucleic acid-binding protein